MTATRIVLFSVFYAIAMTAPAQDLLQTYELALANDPVLKQAQANLAAVGETDDQSLARLLPTLWVDAASSFNRLNNKKLTFQGEGVQEYWNNSATLNLSQPVFHWEYWVQLSQADNQIAQAEAQYLAEQQNLMLRVTEAYFNILAAQDNQQYTKAEKDAIAKQLEQAEQRFEVGLIAITDVDEARAGFDRVRADEIAADYLVDDRKEKLREIIGDNAADLLPLGKKLPLNPPQPQDIDAWSKIADGQNLAVISALNAAEVARKTIELQRSGHYPSVDLIGNVSKSDNSSTFGLRGDQESIGLQLNIPLFEGGAVNSRVRQAEYQYEQSKEKLLEARRAVNREVKNAYRALIAGISRVEALKTAVVSAQSALEATTAGFDVGTRTMVDVLKVQSNLYSAKRDYARARYDYLIFGIRLKQSASMLLREDLEEINRLLHSLDAKNRK
ncbi:MAG: TolC family outer membrane protein [Gammaproteobacteria bacterium]